MHQLDRFITCFFFLKCKCTDIHGKEVEEVHHFINSPSAGHPLRMSLQIRNLDHNLSQNFPPPIHKRQANTPKILAPPPRRPPHLATKTAEHQVEKHVNLLSDNEWWSSAVGPPSSTQPINRIAHLEGDFTRYRRLNWCNTLASIVNRNTFGGTTSTTATSSLWTQPHTHTFLSQPLPDPTNRSLLNCLFNIHTRTSIRDHSLTLCCCFLANVIFLHF